MLKTDGTFGYFGDLPYIGPVEVSMLYSVLQSSRVHKLSERMMFSPRSLTYFMEAENSLAEQISNLNKDIKKLNVFPVLNKFSSSVPIFHKSKSDFINIVHGCSRAPRNDEWLKINLDVNEIDMILLEIMKYVFGSLTNPPKFLIMNCDLLIKEGSGGFVFSLLIIGLASIFHSFSSVKEFEARLDKITVGIHVLDTQCGRAAGDKIHLYIENQLRLSVSNSPTEASMIDYQEFMEKIVVVETANRDEWFEEIRSSVIDWFEELCDIDQQEDDDKIPVILVILPDTAEKELSKSKILDSYTSYPMQIVEVSQINEELFNVYPSKPVIFLCSSSWICNQAVTVKESVITTRFNFKRALHCGFIENQQSIEEELVSTCTFFFNDLIEADHFKLIKEKIHFVSPISPKDCPILSLEDIYLPNGVFLFFRRFLCKYSPETFMPRFSIPENFFIHENALRKYEVVIKFMEMAGAIRVLPESGEVELTPIGRFLSFQFRYHRNYMYTKRFSILGGKIVMWGYILRQSEESITRILQEYHPLSHRIKEDLDFFCDMHKITLEQSSELNNFSVMRHLATYGLERPKEFNRLHYVLSLPSGKRERVRNHYLEVLPTTCRGWNSDGGTCEARCGQTYCYPSSSILCEITEKMFATQEKAIQCPLELSYPLLVFRSLLHISFHDNCIFLESVDELHPITMPLEILRSHTVKAILSSQIVSNAGRWLDGVGHSCSLILSNESLLDFMRYKGGKFTTIGISGKRSKKRARETSEYDSLESSCKNTFNGKLPRSEQEKQILAEFVAFAKTAGVDKAEKNFRGKRGFLFLDPTSELHPYYLHLLEQRSA